MKNFKILTILTISIIFFSSLILAKQTPKFKFKRGSNVLTLQLVNNGATSIQQLQAKLSAPSTIDIRLEREDIISHILQKNRQQPVEVPLTILIGNDVTDQLVPVTLNLKDDRGHCWSFPINIEIIGILPERYELFQNYSNPFNSQTIIKYHIPQVDKPQI